jgi:hypothetical protein
LMRVTGPEEMTIAIRCCFARSSARTLRTAAARNRPIVKSRLLTRSSRRRPWPQHSSACGAGRQASRTAEMVAGGLFLGRADAAPGIASFLPPDATCFRPLVLGTEAAAPRGACPIVRSLARHGAIAVVVAADRGGREPAHPAGQGPLAAARDRQHLPADRAAGGGRHPRRQIQSLHHRHPAHRARARARRLAQRRLPLEQHRPDRTPDRGRHPLRGRELGADRPFPPPGCPGRDRR